jgi:8-oxo-dGTP pyrophosphatase MutT (NUDIX family)
MKEKYINYWKNNGIKVAEYSGDWKVEDFNRDIFGLTNYAPRQEKEEFNSAHAIVYFIDEKVNVWLVINKDKESGQYNLPGGHREFEEKEKQTLIRELREELDVEVMADNLQKMGDLEYKEAIFPVYFINIYGCELSAIQGSEQGSVEIGIVALEEFIKQINPETPFGMLMEDFRKLLKTGRVLSS